MQYDSTLFYWSTSNYWLYSSQHSKYRPTHVSYEYYVKLRTHSSVHAYYNYMYVLCTCNVCMFLYVSMYALSMCACQYVHE